MSVTRSVISNEWYSLQINRGLRILPELSVLCSDLLQAVRVINRGYIPDRDKNFHFSKDP